MSGYQERGKNFTSIDVLLSIDGLFNLVDHIEAEGDPFDQLDVLRSRMDAFDTVYKGVDDIAMRLMVTVKVANDE